MRADAGCLGAKKCEALKDSTAEFVVARRRSNYKKQDELDPVRKLIEKVEHAKASICSKVKHVFHEVTNMFRYSKCRYKRSGEEHSAAAGAVRNGESGAVAANTLYAVKGSCALSARN